MSAIKISQAKDVRQQLGLSAVVIFGVDAAGTSHVATHGETRKQAQEAAKAGNKLKTALGWPADLCKASPLPRTCANCVFFKPDYGIWCFNGWSGDGSTGHCLVEPIASRVGKDSGCRHFEPKD